MRIEVHVQPRATRTEIVGMHGGRVKIRIGAPAVDNAANDALVRFLADHLGVPRRCVRIVGGASSRLKVVEIDGLESVELV